MEPMTSSSPAEFGRVDPDGTVYVRTADGERSVGQIPDASETEALAFYTRRFEALELEVSLLERRIASGALSLDEARHSINTVTSNVSGANAVGDLDGLAARLDALAPVLAQASEARKAERAKQVEAAKATKEGMVTEAEQLALGDDWRGGVNRFRSLLDEWKALPRIDRATDDALWHRFSAARTTYTRRRKAQFAEQAEKREGAKQAKEQIIAEARTLADSTEWGATSGAFRDLMTRWKAAGAAPRDVDDALWAEFRGLQDQFFNARQSTLSQQDAEFKTNLDAKEALLAKAEAEIVPVTDLAEARNAFRSFLDQFERSRQGAARIDARTRQPGTGARVGRPSGRRGRMEAHRSRGPGPRRRDRRDAEQRDRQADREDQQGRGPRRPEVR